jgi:hypothetical protein
MRPCTRSLHLQSSPLGTDPQPANASTTPAGSQLQSEEKKTDKNLLLLVTIWVTV